MLLDFHRRNLQNLALEKGFLQANCTPVSTASHWQLATMEDVSSTALSDEPECQLGGSSDKECATLIADGFTVLVR